MQRTRSTSPDDLHKKARIRFLRPIDLTGARTLIGKIVFGLEARADYRENTIRNMVGEGNSLSDNITDTAIQGTFFANANERYGGVTLDFSFEKQRGRVDSAIRYTGLALEIFSGLTPGNPSFESTDNFIEDIRKVLSKYLGIHKA